MSDFLKKIIIFSVIFTLGNLPFPAFLVHAERISAPKITPPLVISNTEKPIISSPETARRSGFPTPSATFSAIKNITSKIALQAQEFSAGYVEGFRIVKSSIGTGANLSLVSYKNIFEKAIYESAKIQKTFLAIGHGSSIAARPVTGRTGFATPSETFRRLSSSVNLASVGTAISSSGNSLWCAIKGIFGFDCPSVGRGFPTPSATFGIAQKVPTVTPAIFVADENIADGVANPVRPVIAGQGLPTPSETFRPSSSVAANTSNQVLSFSSIIASLKSIFAPLSTVSTLETRVGNLEGNVSSQKMGSDILALQKRVDALTSSNFFNPSYSYAPVSMIGADTKAVVFNAGGPNGVFEKNISSQTATISEGLSAGSITTGGTLSVTGATTLVGALTAGGTLYLDAVNGRLGVGTSTPTDTFSVNGPMYLASAAPSVTTNRLYNSGSDLYWAGNLIGGATTANWTTDGTHAWRAAGNVGIGTASPSYKLDVTGSGRFTSYLDASYFTATTSTATSTFAGGLNVAGVNGLTVLQNGKIGMGTTSPDALLSLLQTANGTPFLSAYRITDSAPSGDFINYKSKAGTTLFRVDNSGNLLAGGIINTGSQTITSISSPQFRVQYDASNEITTSVSGTGAAVFGVNGTAPSLSFTPQSNSINTFNFTDALSANSILSIDTSNRFVGIGTTTPAYKLSVEGSSTLGNQALAGYFTATSTTATSILNGALSVIGNTIFSNATSSNFFSTIASSTNLFAQSGSIGSLSANTLSLASTLLSNGLATFQNGFLSNSSSTITSGLFSMNGGASTTNLTASGTGYLASLGGASVSSLTANYLPKWNSGVFANSVLFDDGTNIGIGTTTPSHKLSVEGSSTLGNSASAGYFTATTSNATSTMGGSLAIDGTTRLATSLSGILKATAGYITAGTVDLASQIVGILGVSNGGTGISSTPSYGNILVGNSSNTYDLTATSSLGLLNSIGAQYSTAQTGSAQTFATSTDTNIGLTIVSSGNTHTFTPTWTGTLANSRLTNSTISGIALGSNLADLTATDGTLTFSGSYNGGAARTIGLNLGNANIFTALQQFNANASTTQLTVSNSLWVSGLSGLLAGGADGKIQNAVSGTDIKTINGSSILGAGDMAVSSTTLLANNNTWSGANTFTSALTGTLTGNASTATLLQNARLINGTSFNGGSDITITAASSTLLANNNTWSGTNVFGTLGTGNTWNGTAVGVQYGGTGAATLTGLLQGNGTSALTGVTGTAGQFPYYNGTNTLLATSTIFLSTSGNVGIGTTNPGAKLDVLGTQGTINTTIRQLGVANIYDDTAYAINAGAGLTLGGKYNSGGQYSAFGAIKSGKTNGIDSNASGYLSFYTTPGTGVLTEQIRIDTAGNVGIGNTSPSYKLDVAGFINTDQYSGYKQAGNTVLYASTTNSSVAVGASSAAAWMSATSSLFYSTALGQGALNTAPTSGIAQYNTAVGYNSLANNTTGYYNTANGVSALQSNTTGYNNTANGLNALYYNTTGDTNTASGLHALFRNTTGVQNTANGVSALSSNITGSFNTASGVNALLYNQSATSSTAIGTHAAQGTFSYSNQGGVYLGYQSGYSAATGSDYNTMLGYNSGYGVTTGARNVLIGNSTIAASYNQVTTGSNNIAIGNDVAVPTATASNQLSIGNLIYGTGLDGTGATVSTGNIGIGTTTPASKLDVYSSGYPVIRGIRSTADTNDYKSVFTAMHETSGDMTDGFGVDFSFQIRDNAGVDNEIANLAAVRDGADNNGKLLFATRTGGVKDVKMVIANGGNVGIGNTSPSYKLDVAGFINTDQYSGYKQAGNTVLYASTTNSSVAVGASSAAAWMSATSSLFYATAIGQGALATAPTSGAAQYNTAVGYNALLYNTTGYYNTANGVSALASNTTGYHNTANGVNTLFSNTTGYYNTASGVNALYYNQSATSTTAVGTYAAQGTALYSNQGGVYLGYQSGTSAATGSDYNTMLGYNSGYGVTTGANNILIGANAGYSGTSLTTGSNNIIIGYNIGATSTAMTRGLNIGNLLFGINLDGSGTTLSTGNIGIGTTTPYAKLSVVGQTVSDYFTATSLVATSTFAGDVNVGSGALTYTNSSGVIDIANLSSGAQSFESDAGIISWTDLPVSSASVLGTVNSYSAQMDGNPMLTVYSESLGDGSIWKNAIGIGTTTPIATLQIQSATSTAGTTPIFDISGLTGTSFMRMTAAGALSVYGTTTIGVSGEMAGLQIGNGGICVDSDGSCTASTTGRISSITSTVGATDVAENYSSEEDLEPGDIVATRGKASVGKADSDEGILGIISTDPGVLLGFSLDVATTTTPKLFPVALSGRVPVKVSAENGAIKTGDHLTLSSIPGVAMKATVSGNTIGIALEDWNSTETGKILTFVNLSWQGMLADAIADTESQINNSDDSAIGFFDKMITAVKGQIAIFTEIITDKITALKGLIIGTSEKPAGITIYDEATGEPYCIKVKNGAMVNESGVCDIAPAEPEPEPVPTPEPEPDPVVDPEPVPTPTPDPSPDTTPEQEPTPEPTPEPPPAPEPAVDPALVS